MKSNKKIPMNLNLKHTNGIESKKRLNAADLITFSGFEKYSEVEAKEASDAINILSSLLYDFITNGNILNASDDKILSINQQNLAA